MTNVKVFLDRNYPEGSAFCRQFLNSSEFETSALKQLVGNRIPSGAAPRKDDYAKFIAARIFENTFECHDLLLAYCQRPRKWLSFKLGTYCQLPALNNPYELLAKFGKADTWYGPIRGIDKAWYIKVHSVNDYRDSIELIEKGIPAEPNHIRWTILAEITTEYLALTWDGFTYSPGLDESRINSRRPVSYEYTKHIHKAFKEIESVIGSDWEEPMLSNLVLDKIWDKYLYTNGFTWKHLRINAEREGVFMNARSSPNKTKFQPDEQLEIGRNRLSGLEIYAGELAEVAIRALGIPASAGNVSKVQKELLQTMIRNWGPKSYEFSLDKAKDKLFRGHCFFGVHPDFDNEDSLKHVFCYHEYGGSNGALDFLLQELGVQR